MIEGYNCVYNEADKVALAKLTGYQYKVLRYMAARADEYGVAHPTASEIATGVGCHPRHVWRCLYRLIALKYIAFLRKGEFDPLTRRKTPNVYQVSPRYKRLADKHQEHAFTLWTNQIPCDSLSSDLAYGQAKNSLCHASHNKESSKESSSESDSRINQESSSTAANADDLSLNKVETQGETAHGGTTAGAQALRAEAANAAEMGEGQDKTPEQPESRKKPATRQPAGQKKPTPHSPPPADDETQEADARRYPQPDPITTPLEDTAEALATRLHDIGIPRPLGRALIQQYSFFQAEQALVQVHAATRTTTVTSPSGLFRHFLQKPIIDPGVEKNVKPRRTKKAKPTELDYTGGEYADLIES